MKRFVPLNVSADIYLRTVTFVFMQIRAPESIIVDVRTVYRSLLTAALAAPVLEESQFYSSAPNCPGTTGLLHCRTLAMRQIPNDIQIRTLPGDRLIYSFYRIQTTCIKERFVS